MRILHVVASLGLRQGGVSVSVRALCEGLAQLGHEVRVVTTRRDHDLAVDGPADARLAAAGVSVQYLPVHPWRWLGERCAYSPGLIQALRTTLPTTDVAHLHGIWQYPTAAAAAACRRQRVPYVVSPCGALDPPAFRTRPWLKWAYGWLVERRTLARAAAWHFTSALEQRRAATFGVRRRGVVIPCPLPPAPPAPPGVFRTRHPETRDRPLLLFLGRLHRKKRLDLVVEAFLQLARRRQDIHLVVAGPDEGEGAPARRRLAEAGAQDRVTILELLVDSEKTAAFQDSTVFLLPSDDENFGLTVAEAMAAGVPVLVSPHVGLAESVAAAGAGLVVDGDAAVWAAAIERLLDAPAQRQAMGDAGRRFAAGHLRPETVAGAMAEAYDAARRRPRPGSAR